MKPLCGYTFRQLFLSVILFTSATFTSSMGQEQNKALQGNVTRNSSTRVQRFSQSSQAKKGAIQQSAQQQHSLNSFLERNDFQLPKSSGGSSIPQPALALPALDKSQPFTGTLQDKSNIPSFSSKTNLQAPPSTGDSSSSATNPIHHQPKATKQVIVIRLTYYMLDEQNPFYAFRFAEQLQKKHQTNIDIVVLLEKEGTRCANKEQNTHMIVRNEKTAHKLSDLITSFIQNGGQVVASREWAKAFGVTEANLIQGVQLCDNDEVGDLIVNASKILEY